MNFTLASTVFVELVDINDEGVVIGAELSGNICVGVVEVVIEVVWELVDAYDIGILEVEGVPINFGDNLGREFDC